MRTFVIGDVHGCAGALGQLLEVLRPRAAAWDTFVMLGDYIDRGPDSRGVIDRVLAERDRWPGSVVALHGNHEQALQEVLTTCADEAYRDWLGAFAGRMCLTSYGLEAAEPPETFVAAFPEAHRRFLRELRHWHEDENGIYVHAGVPRGDHPGFCRVPEAFYWTDSTDLTYNLGKPVVFGHALQKGGRPLNLSDRIGLDTGCGFGGPLTAVILPEREFVAVAGDG